MKAVVNRGPRSIAVEGGPDPAIETPLDVVVRITTTNICGSDLHMYEGRAPVEEGTVLGHENIGIVDEVGSAVERIRVGDRVSVPSNIACGACRNCQAGHWGFCLRTNPNEGMAGAAYGYSMMGPYRGGQAEYLRAPYADVNLLWLPPGDDHELDFTMLSDIFPTGFHATETAGVAPGDAVAVFGGGPVGLMAAHSSFIRRGGPRLRRRQGARPPAAVGADRRRADRHLPRRPRRADHAGDRRCRRGPGRRGGGLPGPRSDGRGAPRARDGLPDRRRAPDGGIGAVGVYVPQDPGAPSEQSGRGRVGFDFGTLFTKGLRVGTGQAPVKRYNRHLRDLIVAGRARPSFTVSHELSLGEAPGAYERFGRRDEGWTKVLMHPGAS